MGEKLYHSGSPSGFKYENSNNNMKGKQLSNEEIKRQEDDKDLVIEENTIYEIDRECYERLKRQRRYKAQEKKRI